MFICKPKIYFYNNKFFIKKLVSETNAILKFTKHLKKTYSVFPYKRKQF